MDGIVSDLHLATLPPPCVERVTAFTFSCDCNQHIKTILAFFVAVCTPTLCVACRHVKDIRLTLIIMYYRDGAVRAMIDGGGSEG